MGDNIPAAQRLFSSKEEILSLWEKEVRNFVPPARDYSTPILIDTMPKFLDNLAEALSNDHPRILATDGCTIAQEHGGERARVTHSNVVDLLTEYQLLAKTVFKVLNQDGELEDREKSIIQTSIDDAARQSALAFTLVLENIRQQFLATLTHDLRGPLTAARANIEMILRHPEKMEKHVIYGKKALENLKRIDKMITDLLDVTRIQAGETLSFEMFECNLVELVSSSIEEFETVYGDRFKLIEPPQVFPAWVNCEAIKRALENLVSNAVKYGSPDTPITLQINLSHGRVILSVHNLGPPIPTEEQETLFEAFRRTSSAQRGSKKGWGLGLALVRGVAEAHGGSIIIESIAEKGTLVGIDILIDARDFAARQRH